MSTDRDEATRHQFTAPSCDGVFNAAQPAQPMIPLSAMRAIAVEAIRAVTGAPDVLGNGLSLVAEIEDVAKAAAGQLAAQRLTDAQIDEVASALFYADEPENSVVMAFRSQWLESIARPLARAIEAAIAAQKDTP